MILKASQRGGGKALALHLLKTEENEHVEVHDLRGFCSDDLTGAMKETHAVSQGTKCRQYLFSVSLNPPAHEDVRTEIFEDALSRIEQKMGLEDQPRAVVFHEKEGRRHAHAVWSRIDADTMTAVQLSHFKVKLREVSREIYLEHGWKMPRGLMNSKERDPRNFSLEEWQQAKRAGHNAGELKETILECWATSDSRAAFEHALESRGLYLARGDRRGHVALTFEGDTVSIARATKCKTREIEARLGDPARFRSVEETKAHIASQVAPRIKHLLDETKRQRDIQLHALNTRRQSMRASHADERGRQIEAQQRRRQQETKERALRLRTGVRGFWDRITGERTRTIRQNHLEGLSALRRDADQRETLRAAQLQDRRRLQADIANVRCRFRERTRALHADIVRLRERAATAPRETPTVAFQAAAHPTLAPERPASPSRPAMPTAMERLGRLREGKSKSRDRDLERE